MPQSDCVFRGSRYQVGVLFPEGPLGIAQQWYNACWLNELILGLSGITRGKEQILQLPFYKEERGLDPSGYGSKWLALPLGE